MTTDIPPSHLAALEAVADEWCRCEAHNLPGLASVPDLVVGQDENGKPLRARVVLESLVASQEPLPFGLRVRHGPFLNFAMFKTVGGFACFVIDVSFRAACVNAEWRLRHLPPMPVQ